MAVFLSNIGNSAMLRKLVSQTDIKKQTVSVVLDKPRTLEIVNKNAGPHELTVRCRDIEERVSVVLHLPFEEDSVASATIIDHTESSST
jgi:hypothetical protein